MPKIDQSHEHKSASQTNGFDLCVSIIKVSQEREWIPQVSNKKTVVHHLCTLFPQRIIANLDYKIVPSTKLPIASNEHRVGRFMYLFIHCLSKTLYKIISQPFGNYIHAEKPKEVMKFNFCFMGYGTDGHD